MKNLILLSGISINYLKIMRANRLYFNELGYVFNKKKTNENCKKTIRVMSLRF